MVGQHDDAGCAGDEIHRTSHSLDHFSWNGPVGQITVLGNLQRTQNRNLNMPAADHAKGGGGVKNTGAGKQCDRLLARVDEVSILFPIKRERTHA